MDEKNVILHLKYWVAFLTLALIVLLSVRWGAVADLLDRINFAVALTSLVLAAFAIGYAMVSGAEILQRLGGFEELSKTLDRSAGSLDASTRVFEKQLSEIPGLVGRVETRVQSLQDLIQAGLSPSERTGPQGPTPGPPVERLANGVLIAWAVATLAADHNKPISVADLSKALRPISVPMLAGMMTGVWGTARSLGLLQHEGKAAALKFSSLNPELTAKARAALEAVAASDPTDGPTVAIGDPVLLARVKWLFSATGATRDSEPLASDA